jgi:uncharacterized integral membrane protein
LRTIKLFFYGLLTVLFVIFVVQNYSTLTYSISIRLNLGFLTLESIPLPFFLIAPILFFSGLLLATLIGLVERRRLSKELKQAKIALQISEQRTGPQDKAGQGSIPTNQAEESSVGKKPLSRF